MSSISVNPDKNPGGAAGLFQKPIQMKKTIILSILILTGLSLTGQTEDPWFVIWNQDTTLIGFKDKYNQVKIEPKFLAFTPAKKFDLIIAVTEEADGDYLSYYLVKSGGMVGEDSLYFFDNVADCESEGFIRFRDKKTDKAGMFNRNGEVVIPAEYNDLKRVRNGLVAALKDAEKKYPDGKTEGDDHFIWTGGNEVLVDTTNKLLVDHFKYDDNINFYSLKISAEPDRDSIRRNFRSVDGKYYSFIDFEKEFDQWLQISILSHPSRENLLVASNRDIYYWLEPEGWISRPKKDFMRRNYKLIRNKLLELKSADCDYAVFTGGLNPFIYESEEFADYFDNCGGSLDWIYPVMDIVITHDDKNGFSQDHLEFLRTVQGYRLIAVTIQN